MGEWPLRIDLLIVIRFYNGLTFHTSPEMGKSQFCRKSGHRSSTGSRARHVAGAHRLDCGVPCRRCSAEIAMWPVLLVTLPTVSLRFSRAKSTTFVPRRLMCRHVVAQAASSLPSFRPCTTSEVRRIIMTSPVKSCSLDAVHTFLVRRRSTRRAWSTRHWLKVDYRLHRNFLS